MRVFRDQTGLGLTAELWPAIERALGESEFFVLLASPDAAKSLWVGREIEYWLTHRSAGTLLVVWTGGTLAWDRTTGTFECGRADSALPPRLEKAFRDEPLYLDFRWARSSTHLSLRDPRFLDAVATIASALYQRPKEDLCGEEVEQFRRRKRLIRFSVALLSLLLLLATVASVIAAVQRNRARQQEGLAHARLIQMTLNNAARLQDENDLTRAAVWSVEALALEDGDADGENRLRVEVGSTFRACPRLEQVWLANDEVIGIECNTTGEWLTATSGRNLADPQNFEAWSRPHRLEILETRAWNARTAKEFVPATFGGERIVAMSLETSAQRILTFADDCAVLSSESTTQPLRLKDESPVEWASFDAGGTCVITVGADHTAALWDAASGRRRGRFPHPTAVLAAMPSPDGKTLLTMCASDTVYLWDVETATARALKLSGRVSGASWSGNGAYVLTWTSDGDGRAWSAADLRQMSTFDGTFVNGLAVSPNSTVVAVESLFSSEIDVWDVTTNERLFATDLDQIVTSLAFSPDGRWLAAGGNLGAARIWDARSGKSQISPLWHQGPVGSLCFGGGGDELFTASGRCVRKWKLPVGSGMRREWPEQVKSAAFNRDGSRLLVTTDFTGTLVDLAEGSSVALNYTPAPCEARQSTKGDWIVPLDDPEGGEVVSITETGQLWAACFSPDGHWVVTGSEDWRARLWDSRDGTLVRTFTNPLGRIRDVDFSPDSRFLLTAVPGGIKVWDVDDARAPAWSEEGRHVERARFCPDGRHILVIDENGLKVWDTSTKTECEGSRRPDARSVIASRDGRWFATDEGCVRAFDVASGRPLATPIPLRFVHGELPMDFSPDGSQLLVADGDARIHSVTTSRPVTPPLRHRKDVSSVVFSADGRLVATGSQDKTARVWDARTGVAVTPPLPHADEVTHVAFSRDAHWLAVVAGRSCVVWSLEPEMLPLPELTLLVRLMACARVDDTGTIVPLDEASFAETWRAYDELKSRH